MGRNMFGPIRGPWPDESWKGWWGDNPPYHTPVFVLTNHPRTSITMNGGTTFHFVTDGIHAALKRASEAANGQDVRLGGGVATIRQYLRAKSPVNESSPENCRPWKRANWPSPPSRAGALMPASPTHLMPVPLMSIQ